MQLRQFLSRRLKVMSRKNLYEFLSSEVSALPEKSRILKVGAGGEVERVVRRSLPDGCNLTTLDIDKKRRPDVLADITEVSFDNEFDAVVMAEVLEHVRKPHVAIDRVYAALKSNGKLIITAPFVFPLHDRPHDYFRFTKYGLRYLLSDFCDVKIMERNGWYEALYVLRVRLLLEQDVPRLHKLLFSVAAIILYPWASFISATGKTDFVTSGYTAVAVKSGAESGRE